MNGPRVEAIESRDCLKLFNSISTSSSTNNRGYMEGMTSHVSSAPVLSDPAIPTSKEPLTGVVICVTGLSNEARKQVMDATKRMGGQYSSSLHPQCTHLVVQSFSGRKFEHALKYGSRNGLFIVTLGWFVDSVRRNVRLDESIYLVRSQGENGLPLWEFNQMVGLTGTGNSCLPTTLGETDTCTTAWQPNRYSSVNELRSNVHLFSNTCIFIDSNISSQLKNKVIEASSRKGATFQDHWFIGSQANYVVCEGPFIQKYIGHTNSLVTPMWLLKTCRDNHLQRLVHLSSDLARQVATILENEQIIPCTQNAIGENMIQVPLDSRKHLAQQKHKENMEERQKIIESAKIGVRSRRCPRIQSCQTPIFPITPVILFDSICWSISEPTSSVCVYMESTAIEVASEQQTAFFDARRVGQNTESSFENFTRALTESEKREMIFKNHFLTILLPVDRFGELGPSSRTFFSDGGFTCLQVLDHIFKFYQENMSEEEVRLAIHTDSKHADWLRSLYATKESIANGFISLTRIEFMGSRKCFECLKRVSGENNNSVYELLVRS